MKRAKRGVLLKVACVAVLSGYSRSTPTATDPAPASSTTPSPTTTTVVRELHPHRRPGRAGRAGNLGEDLLGSSGPYERFRVVIVSSQVIIKHAPADSLVGQVPKLPFDQSEPRREGGDKVSGDTADARPTTSDVGMLMGTIVVADHVDLQSFGHLTVDNTQEL